MTTHALLVGCGALGADVGLRLAADDVQVTALRRDAGRVPAPLHGIPVDLTQDVPDLGGLRPDLVVVALTARPRTEDAYRATYVDGMQRALDALPQAPARAVLVSSTAVVGDVGPDPVVDESTPPQPGDGPARVLLEAEHRFAERVPHGVVLRLSGLYGHGSRHLQDRVREGRIDDPDRWTNRIHRDDAAAAVVHLLRGDAQGVFLGTDDEPARLGDVAAFLAERLDAPAPPPVTDDPGHGKRLSNARLRSTGWAPAYPTFREGYADVTAPAPG